MPPAEAALLGLRCLRAAYGARAVEQPDNLGGYRVCGHDQSCVQMHITLRDAARCMSEQAGDGQFRKTKVTGNARERMSKDMGRHIL